MRGTNRTSKVIDPAQALTLNPRWNDHDRELVRTEIERINPDEVRLQQSENAVSLLVDGRTAAWVQRGRIFYRPEFAPDGSVESTAQYGIEGMRYLPLSGHIEESPNTDPVRYNQTVCPKCFIALPFSGQCDNCE